MSNKNTPVISTAKSNGNTRHGHVFSPASRAWFAWEAGQMDTGQLNQREAGKFFPAVQSGLSDAVAPSDMTNSTPPADGKIASANQGNAEFLDAPGTHWKKHAVQSSDLLTISWAYSAVHATRRWTYFITREGWNPSLPLSRAQFESQPFFKVELTEQPYWSHGAALIPPQPTVHDVMLPQRHGYHVLLAVWEVANTGNAFYHVIDLDFTGDSQPGGDVPAAPAGLRATHITADSVTLSWNASSSSAVAYRLYRDNELIYNGPQLTFKDIGLQQNSRYHYAVSAVNQAGVESARSQSLSVDTSGTIHPDTPPAAPTHLHSMAVTSTRVDLMWMASTSVNALLEYIVYREGHEIARVPLSQLEYSDGGLRPETAYRYFVAALDVKGQLSVPSNVLEVTTLADEDTGGGNIYPAWILGERYNAGDNISHGGLNWTCKQTHIAHSPEWAPGLAPTLWRELK
ncbi:lytic polysaccharide monooxygenase [Erwinia tasmaniensis]|uniref:lytic polysaccharide monooxygenase n=1 Tax=Erwinia tasmaniensis TaxID=338565 RepID=UPI003A4DFF77